MWQVGERCQASQTTSLWDGVLGDTSQGRPNSICGSHGGNVYGTFLELRGVSCQRRGTAAGERGNQVTKDLACWGCRWGPLAGSVAFLIAHPKEDCSLHNFSADLVVPFLLPLQLSENTLACGLFRDDKAWAPAQVSELIKDGAGNPKGTGPASFVTVTCTCQLWQSG